MTALLLFSLLALVNISLAVLITVWGLDLGKTRRPLIDQSHEHVDALDLIPAQPNWLEQVARNAGV